MVIHRYSTQAGNDHQSEVWIFDAANLRQGPVCILGHELMTCGSVLHSAWLEVAQSNTATYRVSVREAYQPIIRRIYFRRRRHEIEQLFENYIYPHF